MDNKELIDNLKTRTGSSFCGDCGMCGMCDKAISAIETLSVERDAAVDMLHGDFKQCAYFDALNLHEKCATCKYCPTFKPQVKMFDNWQWRGPKKEGE